ncbi:MAG TPA: EAL domain-containing protein, partial [Rhodocyclaceae bacterium]|nr:EAL domain-containing protein [Rhodocyclaceae bacterium]
TVEAAVLADTVAAAVVYRDARAADEALNALRFSPAVRVAAVHLAEGGTIAEYRSPDGGNDLMLHPVDWPDGGHQFSFGWLRLVHPVEYHSVRVGYISITKSLDHLYSRLALYAISALAIGFAALLLAAGIVYRVRGAVTRAEESLHHLAHIDSVTGLGNRHAFNARLDSSLAESAQFAGKLGLMLIDLDNFKTVNDTLGHQSGDELLRQVGQRLQRALRRHDLVCRVGGDEFAVIQRHLNDEQEVDVVGDKLVQAFSEPFIVNGREFHVTGSIGVSIYPRDAYNRDELLRHADTAMYFAKESGKNKYVRFAPEMNASVMKRAQLENALRRALGAGELALHYQPIFDAESGYIICVEALLRWHSAELGTVAPEDYISVAEDIGLILPIGEWVIETACREVAEWNRVLKRPVSVAVNLSARQLRDADLGNRVFDILADTGLPPHLLELELTETVLMENVHAQIETLRRLVKKGVRLAIDDFGTGYSSMAYLRQLPLDKLKIDRAFIRDLPHSENDSAIVTAIIAMAKGLGLTVTAEGVEHENQAVFLRARGCNFMQGFHYARALNAEEMRARLLAGWKIAVPDLDADGAGQASLPL